MQDTLDECQLFNAVSAMKKINDECNSLVADLGELFATTSDGRVTVDNEASDWSDEKDHFNFTYFMRIRFRRNVGKPRIRWLTLRFDLARKLDGSTTWPSARQALLVVAFDPRADGEGWDTELTHVSPKGKLTDPEAWEGSRHSAFFGDTLLEWKQFSKGDHWSERAWLFAFPLSSISNTSKAKELLVQPVCDLLSGLPPEKALLNVPAVKWLVHLS